MTQAHTTHYLLIVMLCVLMLASACGRRGDLYLPSETTAESESSMPFTSIPMNR